ncbi:MAG TPA: hypothetical protein VKA84_14155 [Gemmatimonadaceae bacterium]|nr:hypothetical protein [Gemmatimonadaceae bacterium]
MAPVRRLVLVVVLLGACRASAGAGGAPPGMDPYAKDLIDSITKAAGLLTVAAALAGLAIQVSKARDERQASEHQRAQRAQDEQQARDRELQARRDEETRRGEEQRWRKAGLAREVLKELLGDPRAESAMQMLDWDGRSFSIRGVSTPITTAEMHRALRVVDLKFDAKEAFVRDAFDAFFSAMQSIEHYLKTDLLAFKDVTYPFSYYARLMAKNRPVFEEFLRKYEYDGARAFLERFAEQWPAMPAVAASGAQGRPDPAARSTTAQ